MIRVALPQHLRILANVSREVEIRVDEIPTLSNVLEALEIQYPMLRGTIRDQATKQRRPFIRFFTCGLDISLDSPDALLPDAVATGTEVLRVVGAMAGG